LAAEWSSDLALSLSFGLGLNMVSKALVTWLASFRNFMWEQDRQRFTHFLSLIVQGVSKVGMLVIIGFMFLPEWPRPDRDLPAAQRCGFDPVYPMCTSILKCDTALDPNCCSWTLLCLAGRLEQRQRKTLFEKSIYGAFVVTPYVRICVKVIIPWAASWCVAHSSDAPAHAQVLGSLPYRGRCCCFLRRLLAPLFGCCRFLRRFLALLFHLDRRNVGGLGYLVHGWPFEPPVLVNADDPAVVAQGRLAPCQECRQSLIREALDQVARKPFDPHDELLEIKMHVLFLTMFAPIMPEGVWQSLLARFLEVQFKGTKHFFVRRRCWPDSASVLQTVQGKFMKLAIVIATMWHSGLVLVSYNPNLARWSATHIAFAWFVAIVVVLCLVNVLSMCFRRSVTPSRPETSSHELTPM